jgi:monoamine oxidase
MNQNFDCIVIGAGISGLVAARNLAKKEVKVLLVEASDRIGGRIFYDSTSLLAVAHGNESSKRRKTKPYTLPYGATKFYPLNNQYLMNEIKHYNLKIKEVKYTSKTFIQVKDYKIISLYELFQKINSLSAYLTIMTDLNSLSVSIDPVHAPFDYEKEENSYLSSSWKDDSSDSNSSSSITNRKNYYSLFKKNILQSDLFQSYDISLVDYLESHSVWKSSSSSSFPSLDKDDRQLIIDFFLLNAVLLFEVEEKEISLLMFLNIISLFHFKFENILSFNFHSYHTISGKEDETEEIKEGEDEEDSSSDDEDEEEDKEKNDSKREENKKESKTKKKGFDLLCECIFNDFIKYGGKYIDQTPLIGVYKNYHFYQSSMNPSTSSSSSASGSYSYQTSQNPVTKRSTISMSVPTPESTILSKNNLRSVNVQSKYPITNTFLQLPTEMTRVIIKLANGDVFQCKQVIVTIPINCLSSIQWYPPLSSVFQRGSQRCSLNNSSNLFQLYALCSNTIRTKLEKKYPSQEKQISRSSSPSIRFRERIKTEEGEGEEGKEYQNKSNITNRMNRILALGSSHSVHSDHNVYQSFIHHRNIRPSFQFTELTEEEVKEEDYSLVSIQGARRTVIEKKQQSFQLMHPDIEFLSNSHYLYHDYLLNGFLRTHWFHLRHGTRSLYFHLCIEAISPWKYANPEESNESLEERTLKQISHSHDVKRHFHHYPIVNDYDMSLYITNADLSPHWTGWIEGGIYMGNKAAEILYPKIVTQPIATHFARKANR